jgi:RNA polymerase sigma factor (sigma-70 family)
LGGLVNPEVAAYERWLLDKTDENFLSLRGLLVTHAAKVLWMMMHSGDNHLAQEFADDLLLSIAEFRGDSLFSTWTHGVFLNRGREEVRRLRREKRQQPPPYNNPLSAEERLIEKEFLDNLLPEDRAVCRLLAQGLSEREIAYELAVPKSTVHDRLKRAFKNASK